MIGDHNIICVASNWFEHPTSKHHVMRRLAERNRVIWVNFHASRRPTLSRSDSRMIVRRVAQAFAGPRPGAPNLDVLSPLVLPWPESPIARWLNARIIVRQVRAALRRLPDRPTQLWLFTPDIPEIVPLLAPDHTVYYCVDEFAGFAGCNADLIERLEQCTLEQADTVIASSRNLFDKCSRRHANTHLVPHGVDYEHFASAVQPSQSPPPPDLRDIAGPILGYMGLVTDYVDLDLIAAAAKARPQWSFVLLGSIRCNVDCVRGLANVHLLGGKPYAELPSYLRRFDIGLIPFQMSRLTRAVNPIKLREYLAAGLPVVSAPMAEVLRYAPSVRTATTTPEFLHEAQAAIELAQDEPAATRQSLVRHEGWNACVEQLSTIVTGGQARKRNAYNRGAKIASSTKITTA